MSFALTTSQILAGTKDVTRRLGWLFLKEGDLLRPVKKCMGLRPGEKLDILRPPLRVVTIRREPLRFLTDNADYGLEECRREGFGDHLALRWPIGFVAFFCSSHRGCTPETVITRIEFSYEAA